MSWKHWAALIALCGLLIGVQVQAQTSTPIPPEGEIAGALRESAAVIQQNGQTNAALLVITVGVVVGSIFLIRPTLQSNREYGKQIIAMASENALSNQQIVAMSVQHGQNQIEFLKTLQHVNENSALIADLLAHPERRFTLVIDALQKSDQAAVVAVNAHTDSTVEPLNEGVGEIKQQLASIIDSLTVLATRDQLAALVNPIVEEMKETVRRVNVVEQIIEDKMLKPLTLEANRHNPADTPLPDGGA